jgi:hypothetical protein
LSRARGSIVGGRTTCEIHVSPPGDDYPAVLRQMKTACCNALYIVRYTGQGATLDQVRKMFAASGITVLMHADFESF